VLLTSSSSPVPTDEHQRHLLPAPPRSLLCLCLSPLTVFRKLRSSFSDSLIKSRTIFFLFPPTVPLEVSEYNEPDHDHFTLALDAIMPSFEFLLGYFPMIVFQRNHFPLLASGAPRRAACFRIWFFSLEYSILLSAISTCYLFHFPVQEWFLAPPPPQTHLLHE